MAQQTTGMGFLTNGLQTLLMADEIIPGSQPSYELCKVIYADHPHGAKIADHPIAMAMFRPREIAIPRAPDDGEKIKEAFLKEWKSLRCDRHIFNTARLARVYGITTLGLMVKDADTAIEVDFKALDGKDINFAVWDPLNTAGSLVLNQDPNDFEFQKHAGVSVAGRAYHRSRCITLMNEDPLYILYQSSAFGFSGRSVYQRALMPLKSFVMTMATDMMIALKAGVLVTKMKSQSSAVDGPMAWLFGAKREMVKEAQVGNVLTIDVEEEIESLNLQNLDGAYGMARKNIIENEAAASGTPAKVLLSETFAEGFGEGTEDSKAIAQFVEGIRTWLEPVYTFMDEIVMYRAWNEDFYKAIQALYPEDYGKKSYTVAFNEWRNSFSAQWPSLMEEPESEQLKGEDVILKAVISVFEILAPEVPPEEKAKLIEWVQNNLNEKKKLFTSPLELDIEEIANYEPPQPMAPGQGGEQEPSPPKPESLNDSTAARKRVSRERLDAVDHELRSKANEVLRVVGGKPV